MIRMLCVDNEVSVLDGIRRLLADRSAAWHVSFASSGGEAMEMLAAQPCDVILADLQMTGMSGVELLEAVKRQHPRTVRIGLAAEAYLQGVIGGTGPAQRYLAKPCGVDVLEATLQRAGELAQLMESTLLCEIATAIEKLPSPPKLYLEMLDLLRGPDPSIRDVGELVASDASMTAKVLQLVNSAYLGLSRRMRAPQQAVVYLGLNAIKGLVLSSQVFSMYVAPPGSSLSIDALWLHSVGVATAAQVVARAEGQPRALVEDALTAGLLHDVGIVVLAQHLGSEYQTLLSRCHERGAYLCELERDVLGACHARVGGFLLGLWGLPDPIVDAVAHHHAPGQHVGTAFSPTVAVHAAEAMMAPGAASGATPECSSYSWSHLEALGLAGHEVSWLQLGGGTATQRAHD